MIKGAVPGHKGGWVMVRDAVKRVLPKEAKSPGSIKKTANGESSRARIAADSAPSEASEG